MVFQVSMCEYVALQICRIAMYFTDTSMGQKLTLKWCVGEVAPGLCVLAYINIY